MSTASATLILEEYGSGAPTPDVIGGYTMTDFNVVNGGALGDTTSTVESPFGDLLTFTDQNGAILDMTRGLADSTDWWNNGELFDYDIFTTGVHWVTILLPVDTYALSFNVGANLNAGGWIQATETDGFGINTNYNFNVGPANTPGFGIYAQNDGSCSTLTSVTIEPLEWGVGNFSINKGGDGSCAVPEPSTNLMFLGAFAGLLLYRARRRAKV